MKYKSNKNANQTESEITPFGGSPRLRGGNLKAESLGNATKLRTPPHTRLNSISALDYETGEYIQTGKLPDSELARISREQRFLLQDTARHILYGFDEKVRKNAKGFDVHHRTTTCNRFRFSETTEIVKSKTNNKSFYRGLMQCADAKTCPVCAAKISERKANEMRVAFNQWLAMGKYVSLVTFTSPHTAKDEINGLVAKQADALSRFWRGNPAKKFKEKYGISGNIRSFEIKHGKNGWHPHFHILVFSDIPLPTDSDSDDYKWIFNRWCKMSKNAGLSKPNHYGLDIRDGSGAGDYVSKYGSDEEILSTVSGDKITWDMADEMTKGHLKTKGNSLTPFQILSSYSTAETKEEKKTYYALFLEYARALKGKTLLKWSRGLRDLFELGHQKTDEEIVAEETDKADLLAHLDVVEWEFILRNNYRTLVLDLADKGGKDAVNNFLAQKFKNDAFEFDKQPSISLAIPEPTETKVKPDFSLLPCDLKPMKPDIVSPVGQRIRVLHGMKPT